MEAFKFNREGKLLLTLGKQDVLGDNTSRDTFNGMADLAVTKNGDIVVADGEGPNTRVAKFAKDGAFTVAGIVGCHGDDGIRCRVRPRRPSVADELSNARRQRARTT
jgi:hypothetical protein